MIINAIYPTYQGEVNFKGIGAPVIFVRTAGCHLRCYKDTLKTLCDTPEALEMKAGTEMSVDVILNEVMLWRSRTGIRLICISGGDPLYKRPDLPELCKKLIAQDFYVSIETSGTLSWENLVKEVTASRIGAREKLSLVLDYKLPSAGVSSPFVFEDLKHTEDHDWIKFVAFDNADLDTIKHLLLTEGLMLNTHANIAVGPYWGGNLRIHEIISWINANQFGSVIHMNVQLHKMATYCDLHHWDLQNVSIPPKI